jgi:hypothetical protein
MSGTAYPLTRFRISEEQVLQTCSVLIKFSGLAQEEFSSKFMC